MSQNASLPPFASWPSFPFEGELRLKPLDDPVSTEPPRHGENPEDCRSCNAPDEAYVWASERWRVRSLDRPTGLPVVLILEPRSHLDLGDLPNLLAAELGVMTVRVERAIRSLDGVARVHVNRWGDGAAHLQVWFLARPYGRLQLQGTFLTLWNDVLPTVAEERWRDNLALIAAWLAEFGGRAVAEPTRIQWTAPARFAPDTADAAPPESGGPGPSLRLGGTGDELSPTPGATDPAAGAATSPVPGDPVIGAPDVGSAVESQAAVGTGRSSGTAAADAGIQRAAPATATGPGTATAPSEPKPDQAVRAPAVGGPAATAKRSEPSSPTARAGEAGTVSGGGVTPAPTPPRNRKSRPRGA